jgi:hypothetical protein
MNKTRKTGRKPKPQASAAAGRRLYPAFVLVVVIMAATGFGWSKGCQAEKPSALAPQAEVNGVTQPVSVATPRFGFEKLPGKWQRPDGGYIIDIRSVEPDGKMNAAYFNPQPIHVAKAEASQDGETINIFLELQGTNYPGSTYNLTYDPVNDCLKGSYFQAAIKQTFDVIFMRLKS